MKLVRVLIVLAALLSAAHADNDEQQLTPEQLQYLSEIQRIQESLQPQHGNVQLPNGVATLNVPDSFYYLSPRDAETVLVDVWGNPPGAGAETLGMLFPAGTTPFDDAAWGVTIEYEEDGYVSDDDADDIDYDELLAQMKDDVRAGNEQRLQQGYEAIDLVGWASPPYYDKQSHKLHWAKEVKFGDQAVNTLNYNIRVLGRKGVLVLNFIAGMDQKAVVDAQINSVLAMAEFSQGSRYEDFNPDIDEVAAYGLGALIAGKVAAKTGLIAAALIFLKKFGVIILAALVGLFGRVFRKRSA